MNIELGKEMHIGGDRCRVLQLPTKDNGGRIQFEIWMQPTPDDLIMPLHSHSGMTETNEMIEGEMEIFTGGRQMLVGPGESYSSSPGVPHRGRNPGKTHSHFLWSLIPEDSMKPKFEQVVGDYMTGCAACGILGHFAILRLEQYLYEGLTGKDYVTGKSIVAEESLKEVGMFIDKAGGLRAVCESAKVLHEGREYITGIAPQRISNKLFELLAEILNEMETADGR